MRPLIMSLALLSLAAVPAPQIPVETYTLENGLTVILSRDDRLPVVAVELRYLVGSAHEPKGRTGFAHLFEHLMFQGSKNFDDEYFKPFEPIGGAVNGTTSTDRTNYYQRVPREYLELALWMESDRLSGLLDALTQEKLDNQRDVVKNERRQRYENTPYGLFWKHLQHALHPEGHPYHHTTIGSHEDLTAASLDDVRAFFKTYYAPANAVLTLTGDFEPEAARALIARYFGDLPAGTRAPRPTAELPTATARHLKATDDVKLPRIHLVWPTPALFAAGDAELDLLSGVLTGGKTSRLYQPLVYTRKLAKDVHAFQVSHFLGSAYVIQATAAPGVSLEDLAAGLDETLAIALATPPTEDELLRVVNGWRKSFYGQVESVLDRAQLLSNYWHATGNADYLAQDLARYTTPDAAAVHAAAVRWLPLDRALRIDIEPGPKSEDIVVVGQEASK